MGFYDIYWPMDDRTRTLIVSAMVLIIILTLIGAAIFYVGRIIKSRQSGSLLKESPKASTVVSLPSPGTTSISQEETQQPTSTKSYKGAGFEISYPETWGLLTCKNSQHFELDPVSGTDQLMVSCDVAQKPITVLVGNDNCPSGETISKGGVTFIKTKEEVQNGVSYFWCSKTTPSLEISHRVSKTGQRATSTQDFSSQIEEMISKLRFGTTS